MVDLVRLAYDVDADRVLEGPSWLEVDRFDVTAKGPARSNPEIRRAMLQALLADRFNLVDAQRYETTAGLFDQTGRFRSSSAHPSER
jgi:uncharacterized protein (TIGR03435 family)